MEKEFCPEHSGVMNCLGRLEANSERDYKSLTLIHEKIDILNTKLANGKANTAVEKARSHILYWVLAACGAAIIVETINIIFKRFSLG